MRGGTPRSGGLGRDDRTHGRTVISVELGPVRGAFRHGPAPISESGGDPRLEVVAEWPSRFSYAWDRTGTRIFFLDSRVTDRTRLRVKIVGVGITPDDDPLRFEQAGPAGVRPLGVSVPPATDQVAMGAQVYELQKRSLVLKTSGLYS